MISFDSSNNAIITLSQFQQFSALSGIVCQRTYDTVQCGGALIVTISRLVISIGHTLYPYLRGVFTPFTCTEHVHLYLIQATVEDQ